MYNAFVNAKLEMAGKGAVKEMDKEFIHDDSDQQRDCELYAEQLSNVSVLGRVDALSSLSLLNSLFTERVNQFKVVISSSTADGI
jgi:hypothetical protein